VFPIFCFEDNPFLLTFWFLDSRFHARRPTSHETPFFFFFLQTQIGIGCSPPPLSFLSSTFPFSFFKTEILLSQHVSLLPFLGVGAQRDLSWGLRSLLLFRCSLPPIPPFKSPFEDDISASPPLGCSRIPPYSRKRPFFFLGRPTRILIDVIVPPSPPLREVPPLSGQRRWNMPRFLLRTLHFFFRLRAEC